MKKQYRKLTKEQKQRGVIFSSELLPTIGTMRTIHEVFKPQNNTTAEWQEVEEEIRRLKDDKFFNNSPYKINEVRE